MSSLPPPTVSYRPMDEPIIEPHQLRRLAEFSAVIVHPSGKHRKVFLPLQQNWPDRPWFFARFGYLALLHPIAVFVRKLPRVHTS